MRAVVDHRHARRGHALADAAGEGGRALAVEVALQAVADRLVQQDAGPAGAEHDRHRPRGRLHRAEQHDGHARGLAREVLGRLLVEELGAQAPAAAGAALAAHAVLAPRSPSTRIENSGCTSSTSTPAEFAMRTCLVSSPRRDDDLVDARVVGARRAVGALHERDARRRGRARRSASAVAPVERASASTACGGSVLRVGRDVRGRLRRPRHGRPATGRRCTRSRCARRRTTRTPRPQVTPAEAVRMMPSSSSSEEVRWCSK